MANSRGRRTIRRALQEVGLGWLLKPTPPAPPKPFWKKIPIAVYAVLAVLALLVTLLEGYPWLSIEEGYLLDRSNPYSELFVVTNTGYIPVTDLGATCSVRLSVANGTTLTMPPDTGLQFPHFADYLGHEGHATIPCFRAVESSGMVEGGAALTITISHALWSVNIKAFRRSQRFRFKSIGAKDGSQHWEFLS
jgi:hypothetical protein